MLPLLLVADPAEAVVQKLRLIQHQWAVARLLQELLLWLLLPLLHTTLPPLPMLPLLHTTRPPVPLLLPLLNPRPHALHVPMLPLVVWAQQGPPQQLCVVPQPRPLTAYSWLPLAVKHPLPAMHQLPWALPCH